jgi:inositol oxygenase
MIDQQNSKGPLNDLEDWDESLINRYPAPGLKAKEDYRKYDDTARSGVREFYRLNHRFQTFDFVQEKKREYLSLNHGQMTVLDAVEYLNTLVDDSDPDIDLSQREHLLQTAEAIRADGHDDWFVLTGFIHDLGKILCLFGESQWAVVGDTFPVGCAFSKRIVYPEFLDQNPDSVNPRFASRLGIYEENCGLRKVDLSWGHDEYLYHVITQTGCMLPEPAQYMIRYHSFYPWHREEDYSYLLDEHDRHMLRWVREFNKYDLYSKSPVRPDWSSLAGYYTSLIEKYLPGKLAW